MMTFKRELYELLSLTAPSGQEKPVADYVVSRLLPMTDQVRLDDYGNVLAEKSFGDNGPTVLLSAHMDTVWVEEDREIVQEGDIWFSSKGPLGADDRAGIAIILSVLRRLHDMNFTGNVRVAFTREEEIGLCGAREISPDWLKDADLAIVVDRRGSRDVVVCNRYMDFCGPDVADFFERVGRDCGMSDWQAVRGGSSDAAVFAERGVPSVNVSAGYMQEHTDREYVNVTHCLDTVRFLLNAVKKLNRFLTAGDKKISLR